MFLLGPKVPIRSKSSYWARSYWVQKFLLGVFLLGSPTNLLDSKIVANQRDSGSYWARSYWAHPLYSDFMLKPDLQPYLYSWKCNK